MFIGALLTKAETGKQLKHPSVGEWRGRMWHRETVGCCVAVRGNPVVVTTRMNPEDTVLRAISQTEECKYCVVSPLSETFLKLKENQTHRDREQDGGCWKLGAGKETGRWCLNVDTFRCTRSKLWGSNAQHGDDKTDR